MNCISCHDTDLVRFTYSVLRQWWKLHSTLSEASHCFYILSYNDRKAGSPLYSYRDEWCSKSMKCSATQSSVMDSEQWIRMHWIGVRRSFVVAWASNATRWWFPRGHRTKHVNCITCHSNSSNFCQLLLLEYHDWPVPDLTCPILYGFPCLALSWNHSTLCQF